MNLSSERPLIAERATYDWQTAGRRDWFIVKAINDAIVPVLEKWSTDQAPSKRILDVGCGNQPFRKLIESLGFEYDSVDPNPQSLKQPKYVFKIDEPLPDSILKLEKYSYILCTEVLEHVFDWHQAFFNFNKLLSSGGRVLITVPFLFPLHEEPEDYWRPTPYAITKVARKHGFTVERFEKIGNARDVLGQFWGDAVEGNGRGALRKDCLSIYRKAMRLSVMVFLRVVYRILISDWFSKNCVTRGGTYLNNVFELSKVADCCQEEL